EPMSGLIAARRAASAATDDFLDTLMAARDEAGRPLGDDTITGLLLTLLFAGQHTSAVLATWTGVLLLQNPRHLDAVLAEQAAVLGTQGMTLAALKQLAILERCIKEAERMHPPLVMLMRKVLEDFPAVYGHLSSSMAVSFGLQLLYIFKFFWWEGGY